LSPVQWIGARVILPWLGRRRRKANSSDHALPWVLNNKISNFVLNKRPSFWSEMILLLLWSRICFLCCFQVVEYIIGNSKLYGARLRVSVSETDFWWEGSKEETASLVNSFKIRYAFKRKPEKKQFDCSILPCTVARPLHLSSSYLLCSSGTSSKESSAFWVLDAMTTFQSLPQTDACACLYLPLQILPASFRKEGARQRSCWTDNGEIFRSLIPRISFPREKHCAQALGALALSRKYRGWFAHQIMLEQSKIEAEVWRTDPDCNINASASVWCIFRSQFLNAGRKRAEVGFGNAQWSRYCSFELKFTSWLCLGSYSTIGRVCSSQIWAKEIMFRYLLCYAPIIEWEHGFGILGSRWEEARCTILIL